MLIKLEAMKGRGKKGTGRGAGRIIEVVFQTERLGRADIGGQGTRSLPFVGDRVRREMEAGSVG